MSNSKESKVKTKPGQPELVADEEFENPEELQEKLDEDARIREIATRELRQRELNMKYCIFSPFKNLESWNGDGRTYCQGELIPSNITPDIAEHLFREQKLSKVDQATGVTYQYDKKKKLRMDDIRALLREKQGVVSRVQALLGELDIDTRVVLRHLVAEDDQVRNSLGTEIADKLTSIVDQNLNAVS